MIGGLCGFLISLLSGYLVIRLLFAVPPMSFQAWSLGFGFGVGLSSVTWFSSLVSGFSQVHFWLDATLLIVLSGLFFLNRKRLPEPSLQASQETPWNVLRFAFIATVALSSLWLVAFSLFNPHGDWDGWAIWNMRARFLERGGPVWRIAFDESLRWSHPDYPLLIPGGIARLWKYAAQETQWGPAVISAGFLISIVGILYGSLSSLRNQSQAMIAVLFLLGAPHFVKAGAAQQADIPLGFFMLTCFMLLALSDTVKSQGSKKLMFLAGMSASLAAWTKNEGMLLLPAILLGRYPFVTRLRGWKPFFAESAIFLFGATPVLLTLLFFRQDVAPPSELLMSEGLNVALSNFSDISRYGIILKAYAKEIILLGTPIPLLIYGFFAGRARDRGIEAYSALLAMGGIVLGHCTVYLMSPYDLQWHIGTSLNRLLLQLWPSAVFITFLVLHPPEQVLLVKPSGQASP